MDNGKKFIADMIKDSQDEKRVFNMPQNKVDYIKKDEYFKNHKFQEVPIDTLIEHNDLNNKVALSNHAQLWSPTGREEDVDPAQFKYEPEKDNDAHDVIYGSSRNGIIKLSNGRHRVRALKNAGYTHVNIPVYSDEKDDIIKK